MKTTNRSYLTVKDLMRILKVGRTTAYGYIRMGRLRHHKVGHLVRITPEDLTAFVEGKPGKR